MVKVILGIVLGLALIYICSFPAVRVRLVSVPMLGWMARGNTLSDQDIADLDPWAQMWKQDGDGHSSWGWRNGPITHGAKRVEWDNDPRPAPTPERQKALNGNFTSVGIDPWAYVATEDQLRSAKRRRQEAFEAEWRQTGPDTWERRDGTGSMRYGGVSLGTIMPGETKTFTIPLPRAPR